MLVSNYMGFEFYYFEDAWPFYIILVFLFIVETLLSVSLYVVEDFNEANLSSIRERLSSSDEKSLQKFLKNKNKYVNRFHAALITVHMFVILLAANIIIDVTDRFMLLADWSVVLYILFIIFILIIFLFFNFLFFFLLPRRLFRHSSEYVKAIFTLFSLKISVIMAPISDFSDFLITGFFNIIGKSKFNREEEVTEDDILSMVQESNDQGIIEDDEVEMINNIFELNDKEAQDIMTNRKNIVGIDGDTKLSDAIKIMLDGSNSRYPVYIDSLDHIIGIIHLKDALRYQSNFKDRDGAIRRYPKLLREARFVSETRKIDDLFKKMKDDKLQMVIVIDEYGQTSGLVAMEDILEEIVGNILDEYDKEETFVESKGEKSYEIDGLTPLEELSDILGIDLESEDEDIETINGFLTNKLGYVPENDDKSVIEYGGYSFKILEVENHIIKSVFVTKITSEDANNNADFVEKQASK